MSHPVSPDRLFLDFQAGVAGRYSLETIRLNLLRLHAGTGSVHSLTTDLGLARDLARDIDLQAEGYREIEDAL